MDAVTIYQRFVEGAPAAVLVHGLIESCLSPTFLDAVAAPHLPASPNPRQLAFSHPVEILLPVVFASKQSVGESYLGGRRDCGRVATGRVYETRVRYAQTQWEFRLVEVELDRPT